jgi:hypothetical protein
MSSGESKLVFVATSDLAGLVRGKSFPVSEWNKRSVRGVGLDPDQCADHLFRHDCGKPLRLAR